MPRESITHKDCQKGSDSTEPTEYKYKYSSYSTKYVRSDFVKGRWDLKPVRVNERMEMRSLKNSCSVKLPE